VRDPFAFRDAQESPGFLFWRVSTVVRALAARKLLARGGDPADRRARVLALTPAGTVLVDSAVPRVERFDRRFFKDALGDGSAAFLERLRHLGAS
jgi:DNA-binding MarR family transcriptional regulator